MLYAINTLDLLLVDKSAALLMCTNANVHLCGCEDALGNHVYGRGNQRAHGLQARMRRLERWYNACLFDLY